MLGARRSQLLAVLPRAVQGGQARQEDRRRGQRSLFDAFAATDGPGPAAAAQSLPDVPELPDAERLAEEKKALGFYMSSHPLTRHAGDAAGASGRTRWPTWPTSPRRPR